MPITNCRVVIGTRASAGPNARTSSVKNPTPAAAPKSAERQPLTVPTASTIVSASTKLDQRGEKGCEDDRSDVGQMHC